MIIRQNHRRRITVTLSAVMLLMLAPASGLAHFSGSDSVDGSEIRWDDRWTSYDADVSWAIDEWNSLGAINIAPDDAFVIEDLFWDDVYYCGVAWAGQWGPYPGADYIELNACYMDTYTYVKRRNVTTHELGHALGLAHSYSGQVMHASVQNLYVLQDHDIADYRTLWGY